MYFAVSEFLDKTITFLVGFHPPSPFEWPLWRKLTRRRNLRAARANKCCVSKVGKPNVGIVRYAAIPHVKMLR